MSVDWSRALEVAKMIEEDQAADAAWWEGKPFTGSNVATQLGEIRAGIAGLARIVAALTEEQES